MGTAKRERQKAGRQARLEAQEAEQSAAKRKRTIIRGAILLVAFIAVAFGISRLVGKDNNNDTVSSGTTVAAGAATTGAGGTDTTVAGASTTAASTASTVTTIAGKAVTGDTPCPPSDGSAERTTSFEKAPPMCIDPAKKYTAVVDTNFGSFSIELDPKAAPKTVNNFVVLSLYHYYDGIMCHRVVSDFVIQCGDPKGDGTGGPGYEFEDELPAEGAYKLGSLAMVAWCAHHAPKWNPINVCSYHLQEAGATPVQEIAYALATAIGVLDAVQQSGQVEPDRFPAVFGSISFFVNAGIRFVDEICKLRAMTDLWDRIGIERYGITNPSLRRFRYGVQVNSLGLTENQPENNVQRIILEMLAVTLSKRARARSIQLPAWNEALGLPRPWDQQWSLRMQQVLAFETDLLEHDDIFDGSVVMEARTTELAGAAWAELEDVLSLGGAFEAIEEIKGRLVRSLSERTRRIESGAQIVVGVNAFTEHTASPLEGDEAILRVDPQVEAAMTITARSLSALSVSTHAS